MFQNSVPVHHVGKKSIDMEDAIDGHYEEPAQMFTVFSISKIEGSHNPNYLQWCD